MLSHLERQIGFEEALHQYPSSEIDVHIVDEPGEAAAAGLRAIQRAIGRFEFTAVVANNDLVALGVFRGLQAAGLSIPQDVSVMGFDNTYLCDFLHPPLTSVATPRADLARSVLDMLFAYIDGREHERETCLSASLLARESTHPPRH